MSWSRAILLMAMMAQVLLPSALRAQVPDHLKCYKIKDSAAKALYTADLGGLAPEPGCQVKVPGKLLCVQTAKTNVNPTPPGAPAGSAAGTFVCYKTKCPKGLTPALTVADQFGTRTVTPSTAQLLCAPAQGVIPTTTTTPTSTTTTTTVAPGCCYTVVPAGNVCRWSDDTGSCSTLLNGVAGSVCSLGGCIVGQSATPGNCCQTSTQCLVGSLADSKCTIPVGGINGGYGGVLIPNAVCGPDRQCHPQ